MTHSNSILTALAVLGVLVLAFFGVSWVANFVKVRYDQAQAEYRTKVANKLATDPILVDCSECNGTGKVTRDAEWYRKIGIPPRPELIGTFECPICGGSGKLEQLHPQPTPPAAPTKPVIPGEADATHDDPQPPASQQPSRDVSQWVKGSDGKEYLWDAGQQRYVRWRAPNAFPTAKPTLFQRPRWRPFRRSIQS